MTVFNDSDLTEINIKQQALSSHPVFSAIQTMDDLRLFMSWHIFAVWDFMSLLKRLQRDLTTTDLPWLPSPHPLATRLINEIVLGEESDELPDGGFLSHYELYLLAMQEVGVPITQIRAFEAQLRSGQPYSKALGAVSAHPCLQDFVTSTMTTVSEGNVYEVLGSFFFGRENVIPQMFQRLLTSWHIDEEKAPMFVYYLKRHIELDGDSHGPAALKIINELTRDNPDAIQQLKSAALTAMNARLQLWDGLAVALTENREQMLATA